jgi:hypothetical protein
MTPRSFTKSAKAFEFLRMIFRFGFAGAAICTVLGMSPLWGQTATWQSIGTSVIAAVSGTSVGIGTTTPAYSLDVQGGDVNVGAGQFYRYNGVPVAFGVGNGNYFFGDAGNLTMAGFDNTATGYQALTANTTGWNNTAAGVKALNLNATGVWNSAYGMSALGLNTTGGYNTAVGVGALSANTSGNNNTAVGTSALASATGSYNTVLGIDAGSSITTGTSNLILGSFVSGIGSAGLSTGSSNVLIGTSSAVSTPASNTLISSISVIRFSPRG